MIRCSAFCLTRDAEHSRAAEAAAKGIDRVGAHSALTVGTDAGQVTLLPLGEGGGLPVVHGWLGREPGEGEFAMVSSQAGRVLASRDSAGTRPLYAAESGEWVSSDHRFFPGEEAALLPPSSVYDLESGRARDARKGGPAFAGSFEDAAQSLAELLDHAIRDRVAGLRRVAVAFSGGLDSSIIAARASKETEVLACSVYAKGSRDSQAARRAAEALGVELVAREIDEGALRRELAALDLPFSPGPMDKALWCIYSVASRAAEEAGAQAIVLGQMADELFGGYAKYQRALAGSGERAAASMMEADVLGCGARGFVRDEAACCRWLEPRFPFADERVLEFGRGLPVTMKIRDGERKAVLREAARLLGLPEGIAKAPKKAAQYSSGVEKMLR